MAEKRIEIQGQWQLRHAAGVYWLLDMEQDRRKRRKMLSLNQVGAELWELIQQGTTEEAAADMLCRRYGLDRQDALGDVQSFLACLEERHIWIRE